MMVASLAPGGENIGDDAPFDLRSYLASEADDIFLDGWDDLPYVGDDEGSERTTHGITRESLLPDDVLDELIRAQQVEDDSAATEHATSNRHGTTLKVQDKAKASTKIQDVAVNKQTQKQRTSSDSGSPSKSASDMPPATTIGQALGLGKTAATGPQAGSSSNNTSKGGLSNRKRRRVEDPSVLDMARRLLEARKSEQSTNLATETSTLCEDNHRLILYLKQLGEKLTKARLENTLLKQLVGENVGQGHAEQAQMLASSQPELAANMGQEKSSRLSVADKVSALSVKHMHNQYGTPAACLRPSINGTSPPAPETPSPPSIPIVNMSKPRTLGEMSRNHHHHHQQQQQQQLQMIQQMQQQMQPHQLQPQQLQGHHHHHHHQQQQQQQQQQQHHHHHHHRRHEQAPSGRPEDASDGNPQQFALQAAAAMQNNSSNPAGVLMDLLKLMEKQMTKKGAGTAHASS